MTLSTPGDEDRGGYGEALDLVGMPDLLDPFVQREQTTDGEQNEGDHESPEVPLAARIAFRDPSVIASYRTHGAAASAAQAARLGEGTRLDVTAPG